MEWDDSDEMEWDDSDEMEWDDSDEMEWDDSDEMEWDDTDEIEWDDSDEAERDNMLWDGAKLFGTGRHGVRMGGRKEDGTGRAGMWRNEESWNVTVRYGTGDGTGRDERTWEGTEWCGTVRVYRRQANIVRERVEGWP